MQFIKMHTNYMTPCHIDNYQTKGKGGPILFNGRSFPSLTFVLFCCGLRVCCRLTTTTILQRSMHKCSYNRTLIVMLQHQPLLCPMDSILFCYLVTFCYSISTTPSTLELRRNLGSNPKGVIDEKWHLQSLLCKLRSMSSYNSYP
jgi:hypothetical protein